MYAVLTLVNKLLISIKNLFLYRFNDEISYFLDSVLINKTADCDISFFDSPDARFTMNLSWLYISNLKSMAEFFFGILGSVSNLVASIALMSALHPVMMPVLLFTSIPAIVADYRGRKLDRDFDSGYRIYDEKMERYCDYFFNEDSRNEIRINDAQEYIMKLYDEAYRVWDMERSARDRRKFSGDVAGKVVLFAGEATMYLLAIGKLTGGIIGIGDVAWYVSLLTSFRNAYMGIFDLFVEYDDISEKVSRIRQVLEREPVVEKGGEAKPSSLPEICFEDVAFRYPGTEADVLSHCSFTIHRGETVGLVGLNGVGKSTILKLMCRFYDPTMGRILIDGKDAREYDMVELRKLFGVLFQDSVNYSFTLRENVAISDLSRMEDADAIVEACKKSRAYDFVTHWEKGINENMTRRFDPEGKELSGGQWQRVALARAFFRDSPVVFLDEPSASLDPVAEDEIFREFVSLSNGKSAVLISHRLSSITLADKVLVLEDGHIVEEGSHAELMEKGGRYAYLFGLQANKYA